MPVFIRSQWGLLVGVGELSAVLGNRLDKMLEILTLEFQPRKAPLIRTNLYRIGYWHANRFTNAKPRESSTKVFAFPICVRDMLVSLGFAECDADGVNPNDNPDGNPGSLQPLKLYESLYDNQVILVNAITDILRRERSCYCDVRAGSGKTRMAGAIFSKIGARALLYIVPRVDLASQTFKDLVDMFMPKTYLEFLKHSCAIDVISRRKITPALCTKLREHIIALQMDLPNIHKYISLPRIGLGMIRGDRGTNSRSNINNPYDRSISIMTIHSAMLLTDAEIAAFDMIVLDEAHEYVSSARHDFIARSAVRWRLAMSATVADRTDGLDPVIYAHLCPHYRRGTVTGVTYAESIPNFSYDEVEFKTRAKVIHYYGPDSHVMNLKNRNTGELSPLMMREMFMRDEIRLALILRELMELYNWVGPGGARHHIYLYCEEIDSVQTVYHYIKMHSSIDTSAPELYTFTGGCRNGDEVRSCARVIVTTYGYAGTGTSIPKMTAMILATSRRAKLKQVLGRCLRRNGDISIMRQYVYICDERTFLRAQLSANMTAFQYYKMPVLHVRWPPRQRIESADASVDDDDNDPSDSASPATDLNESDDNTGDMSDSNDSRDSNEYRDGSAGSITRDGPSVIDDE